MQTSTYNKILYYCVCTNLVCAPILCAHLSYVRNFMCVPFSRAPISLCACQSYVRTHIARANLMCVNLMYDNLVRAVCTHHIMRDDLMYVC